MPELPEVETIRTALEPHLISTSITSAKNHPSHKFTPAQLCIGYTITELRRRGKYLLIELSPTQPENLDTTNPTSTGADSPKNSESCHSGKKELIIHLGMTGALHIVNAADPADPAIAAALASAAERTPSSDPTDRSTATETTDPTEATESTKVQTGVYEPHKHDRAWWTLDNGSVLIFRDIRRFGRIRVVDYGNYTEIPTLANLGPEPFDTAFTPEQLYKALKSSKRRIKTQLLSQRPVAGLGNIYADEALWLAQIRPNVRTITKAAAQRLHKSCIEVLREGIKNGGTTLRDYRQPDGSSGDNQHHLYCYGRAGQNCLRCQTTLKSAKFDGRTTTWCPTCQHR